MKKITSLIILLSGIILFISCSNSKEENTAINHQDVLNESKNDDKDLNGLWIDVNYLKYLKEFKSTKKAQEESKDKLLSISENEFIMKMNLHEGAAKNRLKFINKNTAQIINNDSSIIYEKLKLVNDSLFIEDEIYIRGKGDDSNKALHSLINQSFISGKYLSKEKEVELKSDGTIVGIDSIESFQLNLDYIDAGMQYDKIFFKFKGEEKPRTFLYEFKNDSLIILEIDCEYQEGDYCLEVNKGTEKLRLIKLNQAL